MTKTVLTEALVMETVKNCYHSQFAGRPEEWFDYLCEDSVYLGTGEPLLIGGEAIRRRFEAFHGHYVDVIQESYLPLYVTKKVALVCGEFLLHDSAKEHRVVTRFTIELAVRGGRILIMHIHNSYEFQQNDSTVAVNLDVDGLNFVRELLVDRVSSHAMAFKSGTKTVFVNPKTILYVESRRKKTELVCIDRVISCNSTIGELRDTLPDCFYPLHRGYLVNTQYITGIRRFEVELVGGASLPIPAANYAKIKDALTILITDRKEARL